MNTRRPSGRIIRPEFDVTLPERKGPVRTTVSLFTGLSLNHLFPVSVVDTVRRLEGGGILPFPGRHRETTEPPRGTLPLLRHRKVEGRFTDLNHRLSTFEVRRTRTTTSILVR